MASHWPASAPLAHHGNAFDERPLLRRGLANFLHACQQTLVPWKGAWLASTQGRGLGDLGGTKDP
eukprot:2874221-Amphidinium_carterae.1